MYVGMVGWHFELFSQIKSRFRQYQRKRKPEPCCAGITGFFFSVQLEQREFMLVLPVELIQMRLSPSTITIRCEFVKILRKNPWASLQRWSVKRCISSSRRYGYAADLTD
jgi:hypothetical protein